MRKINTFKVLVGGVVAGLIIILGELLLNGVVLAEQWSEVQTSHALVTPGAAQYVTGTLITLFYGIVLVWMYAAMLPRFGPGPKTAIVAAITFWLIAYVLFLLTIWTNGFVTAQIAFVSIAWGLIEAPIAALVGARLYKDRGVG